MLTLIKKLLGLQKQKNYVSEAEKFMYEFDKKHPQKSASQLAEIKKHERIAYLRDNAVSDNNKNKLWEKF